MRYGTCDSITSRKKIKFKKVNLELVNCECYQTLFFNVFGMDFKVD